VSRADRIDLTTEVVWVSAHGPVLRFAFSGTHRDGVGHVVGEYVAEALKRHQPAAIVLDFLRFEYRFGNDIGRIVQAFADEGSEGNTAILRAAIVATGRTARSPRSLLTSAKILEGFGVKFFPEVNTAPEYVRAKLESATA